MIPQACDYQGVLPICFRQRRFHSVGAGCGSASPSRPGFCAAQSATPVAGAVLAICRQSVVCPKESFEACIAVPSIANVTGMRQHLRFAMP